MRRSFRCGAPTRIDYSEVSDRLHLGARSGGLNAYAFTSAGRIEAPPIISGGSYCVFLHEVGHIKNPCGPEHTRVTVTDSDDTVCVACELAAWRFAMGAAQPTWTLDMHRRFARSIGTYETYATPEEKLAIFSLASKLGFYRTRQDRITAALEETH